MTRWRLVLLENPSWGVAQLQAIHRRTRGRCTYCGIRLLWRLHGVRSEQGWEVDHWIPRADGGDNDPDNLWAACWACNRSKSDLTGGEYLTQRWENGLPVNATWIEDGELAIYLTLG
ncbi:MAG: HNH endonuclease [Planctomycetes bacterium]|nr:HNH endonuclease [Planctomycetota bacterium]